MQMCQLTQYLGIMKYRAGCPCDNNDSGLTAENFPEVSEEIPEAHAIIMCGTHCHTVCILALFAV